MFNGSHCIKVLTRIFSLISQENSRDIPVSQVRKLRPTQAKYFGWDHEGSRSPEPDGLQMLYSANPTWAGPSVQPALLTTPPNKQFRSLLPHSHPFQEFSAIDIISYLCFYTCHQMQTCSTSHYQTNPLVSATLLIPRERVPPLPP